jgi:hypothetical protein
MTARAQLNDLPAALREQVAAKLAAEAVRRVGGCVGQGQGPVGTPRGFQGGRRGKYAAQRTIVDGLAFPSRLEARRWGELRAMAAAGEITDLRRQPRVELTAAAIVYHPDFFYRLPDGRECWEETKGFETRDYCLKRRLWSFYGPGLLRVLKAGGKAGWKVTEIAPKKD